MWGSGKVRREAIYVDDIADACIYFMNKKNKKILNQYWSRKGLYYNTVCKKILKVIGVRQKLNLIKLNPMVRLKNY